MAKLRYLILLHRADKIVDWLRVLVNIMENCVVGYCLYMYQFWNSLPIKSISLFEESIAIKFMINNLFELSKIKAHVLFILVLIDFNFL